MQVSDILNLSSNPIVSIKPEDSVLEAIQLLARYDHGALIVIDQGKVVGVFSERDYTRKVALLSRKSSSTKVKDIMSTEVRAISPSHSAEDCLKIMNEGKFRHLPVMRGEEILGFISILDVANALIREKGDRINQLQDYVAETWPF